MIGLASSGSTPENNGGYQFFCCCGYCNYFGNFMRVSAGGELEKLGIEGYEGESYFAGIGVKCVDDDGCPSVVIYRVRS
jgi:hypothetical protein